MWLLLLEAGLALSLLAFAVWWVMFSGREKGEPLEGEETRRPPPARGEDSPP
jgi:hypothetical protein